MKAAVQASSAQGISELLSAMVVGMSRHGVDVARFTEYQPGDVDFAVVWGWRRGLKLRQYGFTRPILVMERGYLGDRMNVWTSLGWDGLNRRARFPDIEDRSRFDRHFAHLLKPWTERTQKDGYALIAGQVRGDTALLEVDILEWYERTAKALVDRGWDVRFRQHPQEIKRGFEHIDNSYARRIDGALADALAGAAFVVTYNSNVGTDAMMAGVPVHAEDEGSMVYDIASHDLMPYKPLRVFHLRKMAWCQWQTPEMSDGSAWDVVSGAMEPA